MTGQATVVKRGVYLFVNGTSQNDILATLNDEGPSQVKGLTYIAGTSTYVVIAQY